MFLLAITATGQESLNSYYAYPVSVGVWYSPLCPIGDVARQATVSEIAMIVRGPLPARPALQPFALVGLTTYDSDEADDPTILGGVLDAGAIMPEYDSRDTWDHRSLFAGVGFAIAHRMTVDLEIGAELFAGLTRSIFPKRVVTATGEWYSSGEPGLVLGVNGKITLNPLFSISIDAVPSIRYDLTLGSLPDFDGLRFGLGFAVHYRFGRDPDKPRIAP
jgi:hypothetical protein